MITLTEYLQETYPIRPKGLIKGLTEAEQKEIAKHLKTKSIRQVASSFGIEYETSRRIYHKYKGE